MNKEQLLDKLATLHDDLGGLLLQIAETSFALGQDKLDHEDRINKYVEIQRGLKDALTQYERL